MVSFTGLVLLFLISVTMNLDGNDVTQGPAIFKSKKKSKNVKGGIVKSMLVWSGRENKIENLLETMKIIDMRLFNIFSK